MTIGDSGRDLIIYLALMPPLHFLMTSPRIIGRPANTQKGVTLATGLLVTFSAAKIGYELVNKEHASARQLMTKACASAREQAAE